MGAYASTLRYRVRAVPQRISSPRLVGRESELARLQALYARAVSAAFTLALVKGDAGIGKSRLVQELEASDPLADALRLRGSCFPIAGEEAPYGPLVAALRGVPAERLEAAARGLADSVIAELALLLPALGRQAPAGRDGSRGATHAPRSVAGGLAAQRLAHDRFVDRRPVDVEAQGRRRRGADRRRRTPARTRPRA